MNPNLTELVIISDASGSMQSIKTDAEGGINSLLKQQREMPNKARVTLVEFSTTPTIRYENRDIDEVENYSLNPGGSTALNDAVGLAIQSVGSRLSNTPESERPALVIFLISTDGMENNSKEFSAPKIAEMIKHQTDKYSWQFQFMGCGDVVFQQGFTMGIDNSVGVAQSKWGKYYNTVSNKISNVRSRVASGESVVHCASNLSYTDEEKSDLGNDNS